MKHLLLLPLLFLLSQCATSAPTTQTAAPQASSGARGLPQIINVSAYDPKECRRSGGRSYSEHDLSALKANGASALIARAGKGGNLDEKCATFLASADRIGLLPGVYYRLQTHVDAVAQADQLVNRVTAIARSHSWNAPSLLICGDFDANSKLSDIIRFMDRVEARTGVVPVAYLENSQQLKLTLGNADAATKAKIRRMPYWLALYSHESGAGPVFPAPGSPEGLLGQYRLWSNWTLWQYGGVDWAQGCSQPRVYNHGSWRFPAYFGNLDRPIERNVFNGSLSGLQTFWQRHGIRLK